MTCYKWFKEHSSDEDTLTSKAGSVKSNVKATSLNDTASPDTVSMPKSLMSKIKARVARWVTAILRLVRVNRR